MLKLTSPNGHPFYINPRRVMHITGRVEIDGPEPITRGCLIYLAGYDDYKGQVEAIHEPEDVATEVADYLNGGGYGVIDVALQVQARDERNAKAAAAVRDCPGAECPGCDGCEIPF